MAELRFFEKPGCINNTQQKKLLREAGHQLQVYDLLQYQWQGDELRRFFGDLPVAQWFNPSAPAIKEGWVDPGKVDADTALTLMLRDPLLIRRPLLQVGEEYRVGFDLATIHHWIGLGLYTPAPDQDLESCPQQRNI